MTFSALLLLAAATARGQSMLSLSEYLRTLERIHSLLSTNQIAAAKSEATQLRGATVRWSGGEIRPDESLMAAIEKVTRVDRRVLERIATTMEEIRAAQSLGGAPPDPKLLREVATEQEAPELVPGGEVPTKIQADVPFLERLATAIADMFRWLGEKIGKLIEWLLDLFPDRQWKPSEATSGMRLIVWAVVALILLTLILLAIHVARRSKASKNVVEVSVPLGSKRDEDPLSRGASEWERYAGQLAAAGRFREAIRAWYHAVLVTCYSEGVLHFRKGRTNWEYLAMLGPSLDWRSSMIELTRRFEREWYGGEESSRDALDDCSEQARFILGAVRQRGAA